MKKSNFFAAATLLAAVVFTSCNVNDETQDNEDRAVRFTAGIEQAAIPQNAPGGTRASETTWGNDAIGIFMVEPGTTHYANREYKTNGDGNFTAVAGSEMYYPMSGNTVNFIAYYPYESGATLGTPINVKIETAQTDANQPTFDLLYSSGAEGSKLTTATAVALAFNHRLAKIVMNVRADESVEKSLTEMTVTIKGMNTVNTLDPSTGSLGGSGAVADITPRTVTDGSVYDAIIMPHSYAGGAVTVDFTLAAGGTFTWTLDADDAIFASGNEYTYTVTLTSTGVQVTGKINRWNTLGNDRGGVMAE